MTAITEKAMLANHSIKSWSGRKFDSVATDEVNTNHQANDDVARVNKKLLFSATLTAIKANVRAARKAHHRRTLPWGEAKDGVRLLPAESFMAYQKEQQGYKEEFERLVNQFLGEYETAVNDAKAAMGSLWNAEDYPTKDDLADKFSFDVDVDPMADAGDFRVSLNEAEIERLQKKAAKRMQARIAAATTDLWERLGEVAKAIRDPLEGEGRIYKAVFDNLKDLSDILPELNITGDRSLEKARKDLVAMFEGVSIKDLRKDEDLRATKAKELNRKLADMGLSE